MVQENARVENMFDILAAFHERVREMHITGDWCYILEPSNAHYDVSQLDSLDSQIQAVTVDYGLYELLEAYITASGWKVVQTPLKASLGGYTDHNSGVITINALRPLSLKAITLAHEIAHALMHSDMDMDAYRTNVNGCRSIAETEAESVAYMVAYCWGLKSASSSVSYVASWSEKDASMLERTTVNVIETACTILSGAMAFHKSH